MIGISEEQQLKNFNDIADLQDELLSVDINDDNSLDPIYQKLSTSPLLDSKWTFRSVLVSIYTCFLCRPHSGMKYVNFFMKIAKLPKNPFISKDYVLTFTNNFFLYQLYLSGFIDIESIYEQSSRSSKMVKYFYPEIQKKFPNIIQLKNAVKSVRKHVYRAGYTFDDDESIINKFIELRSKGENPDPICLSIRHDDVERLQQLLSQTNVPIDKKIEHSIFERFIFINDVILPTLIEYAAFFGSIECFKFLYQKVFNNMPSTISQFAVAGGNYEIIHLCEQSKVNFDDDSLMVSIRFFRPEITSYLEDNFSIKKTVNDASKAIVYYNLRALMDCEPIIREDPNQLNSGGYTVLTLACLNGDLDIINYLITTFKEKIGINAKTRHGDSPLTHAAEFGHFELVKYLTSFPNIEINSASKDGFTPIMYAIKMGHLNIVKFLAELPKIEIYDPKSKIFTVLEISVQSNKLEMVKYVWNDLVFGKLNCSKSDIFFRFHYQFSLSIALKYGSTEIIKFLKSFYENEEEEDEYE